ncbi:MAG: hypothetical protein IJP92_06220, partial [Lachnospiraceae bacterium]|nr:hypothetical protein [Lachnospiraceae bacterium]
LPKPLQGFITPKELEIIHQPMDFFGINVSSPEVKKAERRDEDHAKAASKTADVRFPVYILFVIIPYFFIMMYTDYFFPVYANSVGVTTDVIGYVMLAYGIATAYIGTKLCPKLIKRVPAALLMPLLLLILAGSFLAFALHNMLVFAVLIVLMIGVIDGIMPSLQFMYVYSLPFAKRIGFSKALGIEGLFSNMIGAVAPVIFGVVMMYGNSGLGIVAVMIAVCAVLFAFINIVHHGRRPKEGVAG